MHLRAVLLLLFLISTVIAEKNCTHKSRINPVDNLVFLNIGRFAGFDKCDRQYHKEYYIPRYFKAHWYQVKRICESFELEAVSLDTAVESDSLLRLLEPHKDKASHNFYIGGMTLNKGTDDEWYWINSGSKINYELNWERSQPDGWEKPGWDKEQCLAVSSNDDGGVLGYNDVFCNAYRADKFVCQSYHVLDTKPKN